jgi:hypothetical protein
VDGTCVFSSTVKLHLKHWQLSDYANVALGLTPDRDVAG